MTAWKVCSKCGAQKAAAEFYVGRPDCKDCKRVQVRARYHAEPELHCARKRASRIANPDRERATRKRWYDRHWQRYYEENGDALRAKARAWSKANPDWHRERDQRRRARFAAVEVEDVDRGAIVRRDGSRCHICGRKVAPRDLTLDHLIPLSKGGPHMASNLRVAHRVCNSRRYDGRLDAQLLLIG